MTTEINKKIEELREVISTQFGENITAVNIIITAEGAKFRFTQRDAKSLKANAISMRNISGKWIN